MNIEKLVTSIPTLMPEQRKVMRGNIMDKLQSGDPAKVESAKALLEALDAFEANLSVQRTKEMEELSRRPFAERLTVAFQQDPLSETEARLLLVLLDSPGGSCAELSARMGWAPNTWDMGMGSLCAQRRDWLHGFSAKGEGKSENLALLTVQTRGEAGEIRYTLKPEIEAVLTGLGMRPSRGARK
jgi:hypothetical protein